MKTWFSAVLLVCGPAWVVAGEWHTDWTKTKALAKKVDKPIFLHFVNGAATASTSPDFNKLGHLTEHYVLLRADKSVPKGKRLFEIFEIKGDDASVVIERDQVWQFCRYERRLTQQELETVLTHTRAAKGKPNGDVLVAVAAAEKTAEAARESSDAQPQATGWFSGRCFS